MNFLAHCVIADLAGAPESPRDALVAGGVIGDFVKGAVPAHWDDSLQLGVRLHRRVDAVSNQNPGLRRSAARFDPSLRRFAPIYLDLMADLLLAQRLPIYHPQSLTEFSQRCYAALTQYLDHLSGDAKGFVELMIERDLLGWSHSWESVERGAESVSRRLRRQHLTAPMLKTLQTQETAFGNDFESYFPELLEAGRRFVEES